LPNINMLTMFAAVSTLNLATSGLLTGTASWSGRKGLWSTMASLNLLGAVINLSVLFIIGDRLERNGTLERRQVMVLSRIFCAAAFWSPSSSPWRWPHLCTGSATGQHTAFWHTGGLAGHGADGLAGRAARRGDL
jgi:hypothetical protein